MRLHRVRAEQRVLPLALAPPDDPQRTPAAQAMLDRIVADAADVVSSAALLWLQRTDLTMYTALLDAGRTYVATRATTGREVLRFRAPQSGRDLDRQLAAPRFCQLYHSVLTHFQVVWKLQPSPPQRRPQPINRRNRVGNKQHIGSARWHARMADRAAAIQHVLASVGVPVAPRMASAWVKTGAPPNRVALQVMAHIIGKEPRTAKAVLRRLRFLAGRRATYKAAPFATFAPYVGLFRTL